MGSLLYIVIKLFIFKDGDVRNLRTFKISIQLV